MTENPDSQVSARRTRNIDPEMADLLYEAWCVIANAQGWNVNDDGEPANEWTQAAVHWRERWYRVLAERGLA